MTAIPDTIYIVRAANGPVKVGVTCNVERRLRHIRNASPVDIALVCTFPGDRIIERRIHAFLLASHLRCEWFEPTREVEAFIASAVDGTVDVAGLPPPKGISSFVRGRPAKHYPHTGKEATVRHFMATYRPQDAAA